MENFLGSFEELVLLAVKAYSPTARVTGIRDTLAHEAARPVPNGAIDQTLRQLARKELVSSRLDAPPPGEKGRRHRYWSITAGGVTALADMETARQSIGLRGNN